MNEEPFHHPWASARDHFTGAVLPRLREHGKAIGAAASSGDERAQEIVAAYELLYRSFDPLTLSILDEKLTAYLSSNATP